MISSNCYDSLTVDLFMPFNIYLISVSEFGRRRLVELTQSRSYHLISGGHGGYFDNSSY
jgi:hypothetical protein